MHGRVINQGQEKSKLFCQVGQAGTVVTHMCYSLKGLAISYFSRRGYCLC